MFSTLRLRQRKGSDKKTKQGDNKASKKQNKWSLEKAFCPGMGGNSTGAETDNTVPRDRQPIHQFASQQSTYNNNTSSTDTYTRSDDDQAISTADYRSNLINFPSSPISYRENQAQNDYKPISRSGTPPSPRQSHQFPTNYNNSQFQQRTDYNNQYYQRYPQECQQCINENLACQQQQTVHQEHGEEDGMVSRVVGLALERDDSGLGINLMGGRLPDGSCTPLTVTYIKPNSPAHKEGTLRVGDRLLAVNGRSLTGLTLREVELALSVPLVWLTVEYDVSLLTRLRSAGPLVVDVESPTKANVGLSLIDSGGKVIVSNVKPASLAERCGALLPGDQILGVNDVRITAGFTAEETTNMLNTFTGQLLQIEILPVPTISRERMCPSPSWSQGSQRCLYDPGGGSSCSRRSASPGYRSGSPAAFRTGSPYRSNSPACRSSSPVCRSQSPCHQLSASCHGSLQSSERCHELVVERGVVTLHAPAGQGFGLKFRWVPSKMAAVISDLETNGVADRSGVLQIGDRITAVNGCRPGVELDPASSVTLEVEFDVEVHQPAAAGSTIRVQLARSPSSGFGITINGSSDYGSSIVISRVRWGSVAHRSGRLAVGDHLLAIGETRLAGDIHLATSVLKHCPNMIFFTILKNPNNVDLGYSSSGLPSVDSTVESWDSSAGDGNAKTSEVGSNYSGLGVLEGDWTDRMTQSLHSIATHQSVEGDSCGLDAGNTGRGRLKGGGKPPPSPPCPLQTNYRLRNNIGPKHWRQSSFVSTTTSDAFADLEALEAELKSVAGIKECGPTFLTFRGESQAKATTPNQPEQSKPKDCLRFKVSLFKDPIYEDFGFSVSDGLYERGVFINRIRPGGPADLSRTLRPFDRIVQVNETKTEDFDCCLTVPLVATSPDPLVLIVERSTSKTPTSTNQNSNTTSKNSFNNMEDEDKVEWVEMGVEVKMENPNNYQTL